MNRRIFSSTRVNVPASRISDFLPLSVQSTAPEAIGSPCFCGLKGVPDVPHRWRDPRWMSPELLDPERFGSCDGRPTKQSDCYALGTAVYEVRMDVIFSALGVVKLTLCQVLCGNPPYWDITNAAAVMHAITEGY